MNINQESCSNGLKIQQDSFSQLNKNIQFQQKIREKNQSYSQNNKKNQNTLSLLTKKFINLIKSKQNMTIDSNDAAKQLYIQKRRIYDITNVLQGIGYVQKIHKNKLRWVGGAKNPQISSQINFLDQQIYFLQKKHIQLTSKIEYLEKRTKNDFAQNKQLNYIRLSYFQQILKNNRYKPQRALILKVSQETLLTSRKNEQNKQTIIQIRIGKQSNVSIFDIYLNRVKQQQQEFIKNSQSYKKVKIQNM